MSLLSIVSISLGAILIENLVFSHLFGIAPFLKDSDSIRSAFKTGLAVTIVTTAASVIACITDRLIITPLKLEYMRTTVFILIAAGLVCIAETVLEKKLPRLYEKLGISFSLVAANSAILGVMLLTSAKIGRILAALIYGFSAGMGFLMAISLFAAVRERLEYSEVPKWLEGIPMALITAGLIALAFMGFQGMKII